MQWSCSSTSLLFSVVMMIIIIYYYNYYYNNNNNNNNNNNDNNNDNNNNDNNIWLANCPVLQLETGLLRAQLNDVRPKELCCWLRSGTWPPEPCTTLEHSTTARWKFIISWELIMLRKENWIARRKIDT